MQRELGTMGRSVDRVGGGGYSVVLVDTNTTEVPGPPPLSLALARS